MTMVQITYIRPSTGELIRTPSMTMDQGRAFWNAMASVLRETATIYEVAS